MTEQDHNQTGQDRPVGELDRVLDAALAKYAAVEPRDGLEARILANLRTEQAESLRRVWWKWALVAATAAIVVTAIGLAWRSDKPSHLQVAHRPPATTSRPDSGTQLPNHYTNSTPKPHATVRRTATHTRPGALLAAAPKLDQFPSPQPLSEQEKILAGYVAKYPDRAALLAVARMEALRHDAEERRQLVAEDRNSPQ